VQPSGVVFEHAPIPEQMPDQVEVEQRRRVARDERAIGMHAVRAEAARALPDREAASVPGGQRRHVAGHARDVPVPAQLLVEHEHPSEPREASAYKWRRRQRPDPALGGQAPDLLGRDPSGR
jgi:hypothetical protein